MEGKLAVSNWEGDDGTRFFTYQINASRITDHEYKVKSQQRMESAIQQKIYKEEKSDWVPSGPAGPF